MKLLHLNVITRVPNAEGERLIEQAIAVKPKDDNRLSKNWFLEQNLIPPADADDDELGIDENGMITLREEHMDTILVDCSIPLKNIDSYVDAQEEGTTVYTKSGIYYNVSEEVWEIDDYITVLSMSWIEKEWMVLKSRFRRWKNKIRGKKEVNLQEILNRPENDPNNYTETIIN